jgi:putative glutamine amidotransferase
MKNSTARPVIVLPACNRMLGDFPSHTIGQKYVDAARLAGGLPLVVPQAASADLDELLALADGVMLTGSPSNVHPSHFGETVNDAQLPLDPQRDAWTLPLIRRALDIGMPVLAICRGLQELNVALGGSLHQAVHRVAPFADHRAPEGVPLEEQYRAAHDVVCTPGGRLHQIVGVDRFAVNSLHGQAINRLGEGLRVEGMSPDGVIEAIAAPAAPGFNLGLQWHPEWRAADNPWSRKIFGAFGQACQNWRDRPRSPLP